MFVAYLVANDVIFTVILRVIFLASTNLQFEIFLKKRKNVIDIAHPRLRIDIITVLLIML